MQRLDRILFPAAIFLGAFLLFAVQPLIARFILPWFGGAQSVWTTCMLFFQALLLGGYAYAHFSASHLRPRTQAIIHIILLIAAGATLPIAPSDRWKPMDGSDPTARILMLLGVSVGLPYLLLASTGPLLQSWIARRENGQVPWRLYALSNFGSLLALAAYPFAIEPLMTRKTQAMAWSIGFGAFALLCAGCALRSTRGADTEIHEEPAPPLHVSLALARVLWLVLPAVAVMMLLATTSKLCLDVAVIPFLWVLPLAIYLLSFIITFQGPRGYHRGVWISLLPLSLGGVIAAGFFGKSLPLALHLAVYVAVLLTVCMICHGELYRLRPPACWLTAFYLSIALGGAIGGAFVAVGAPMLFTTYFEFPLAILLCMALALILLFVDQTSRLHDGEPSVAWVGLLLVSALLGYLLLGAHYNSPGKIVAGTRGFYGALAVVEQDADVPQLDNLLLRHGGITHGIQFRRADLHNAPSAYFGPTSGVGMVLKNFRADRPRRIGTVGLGIGTLAAYGARGDEFRFYELNPDVLKMAQLHFDYLKNSPAKIQHILGDGRLSLEREPSQGFDVLVLDAFSGDAIPVHLLTQEAFETCKRHLSPGGILAVHITNQHLDLMPVVAGAATKLRLYSRVVYDDQYRDGYRLYTSLWAVLSTDQASLKHIPHAPPPGAPRPPILWTDEHSSLFPVLK